MKNYENIFVDLDGTIINSKEGVTKSLKYALEKMNVKDYDEKVLDTFIGPPLSHSFSVHFDFTKEEIDEVISYYRERYSVKGILECTAYEGMEGTLIRLKNAGKKLYLGTSKPLHFAKIILEKLEFDKYFDEIFGASLDGTILHKEDVLNHAFETLNTLEKDKSILVGDTKYDAMGANIVGIDTLGVLYGFGTREEFEENNVKYIVETTAEIADLLLSV